MLELDQIKGRQELAELMEMTAEELDRRAQAMLKRARELASGAITLRAVEDVRSTSESTVEEFRSVSKTGDVVNEAVVIKTAKELGTFTHAELISTLGINRAQGRRWLTVLTKRKYPIVKRNEDATYSYVEPPKTVTSRNQQKPPEVLLIDRAAVEGRGAAVERLASERARRQDLSKPGRAHQIRQQDKRQQRVREAKAARNGKG